VVDAAQYYHVARKMMEAASQEILIIGWDFDTRVDLEPEKSGTRHTLARFFMELARSNPERRISILKWSFGAKKQFFNPRSAWTLFRWWRTKAIDFRFDAYHPPGCSHHQKILIIDRSIAACGGIDIALSRWDTPDHKGQDPRRKLPSGKYYTPWHDVTMIVQGNVVDDLAELGQTRWQRATGEALAEINEKTGVTEWPEGLDVEFENIEIAVSRSVAPYEDVEQVKEIELLYLDMIKEAEHYIYFENQYLTSSKIAAAIALRMEEESPPEFVFVMPRQADGWLEQRAMDAARIRLARAIGKVDRLNRFRIYVPVNDADEDIYVHAKVSIVDNRFIRVGSSNLNNRSLGLDSECDVAIDAALPANAHTKPIISDQMHRLLGEHLGADPAQVAAHIAQTGSLVETINALNRTVGRRLELLDLEKPSDLDKFIADNMLLDPEHPDDFLEPLSQRSLWKNWRKRFVSRNRAARKSP
jgi:phosphatidylserine/phosphatidylglycerophosphate/cardiolipin synthase-like enzyme